MFDYDKLAVLIEQSGKTKTHLCKAMGKPGYYLRDVLKQKTAIPDELQTILAKELGTTVEYLNGKFEQKEMPISTNADEQLDSELIMRLCDLTPEETQKVLAFVEGLLAAR